jgi:hypothetical protein
MVPHGKFLFRVKEENGEGNFLQQRGNFLTGLLKRESLAGK